MRLSPFPPRTDRPIRGVLLYAAHGILMHLRSWSFWLSVAIGPLMVLVIVGQAVLTQDWDTTPLQVVAADATVREHIEASKWVSVTAELDPLNHSNEVLYLDGDLSTLSARLVVFEGAADPLTRLTASQFVETLWTEAHLTEAQRAVLATGPGFMDRVAKSLGPVLVGLAALAGLLTGFPAASSLAKHRQEEYFSVLRLGTPVEVIYLGGLLERGVLAALTTLPLVALLIGAVMALSIGVNLIGEGGLFENALLVPALAISGSFSTYLVSAGLGTFVGTLSRGNETVSFMVLMIPLMGMSLAIPMVESMGAAIDDPGLGLALPGWGALYAARGLQGMLSPAWVGVTLACQVLWGLMALRFATWLFALEDDALGDLRRRLGGLRRAP